MTWDTGRNKSVNITGYLLTRCSLYSQWRSLSCPHHWPHPLLPSLSSTQAHSYRACSPELAARGIALDVRKASAQQQSGIQKHIHPSRSTQPFTALETSFTDAFLLFLHFNSSLIQTANILLTFEVIMDAN